MFDVLLVTGGAGAGKTSTARAWAASRQSRAAHLSHDDVLLFMKSGFVSPAEQASEEAEQQWRLALDICVQASRIYTAAQVQCAIDTYLLPEHLPLWHGLSSLKLGIVVLHPPVEIAVERNAVRLKEVGWGVPEWQVIANHEAMSAWRMRPEALILDNSQFDIAQTIAAVDAWAKQI